MKKFTLNTGVKEGDMVRITTDRNILNQFMEKYAGMEATVVAVEHVRSGWQEATLDVDGGLWRWQHLGRVNQIDKI